MSLQVISMLTDGVPSEPVHLAGGHVHRQLGAVRERGTDTLLAGIRLPEHYAHSEDHTGEEHRSSKISGLASMHILNNNNNNNKSIIV